MVASNTSHVAKSSSPRQEPPHDNPHGIRRTSFVRILHQNPSMTATAFRFKNLLPLQTRVWMTILLSALIMPVILSLTAMRADASPAALGPKAQAIAAVRGWRERVIELDRKAESAQAESLTQAARLSLKRDFSQSQTLDILTREIETPLEKLQELDDERLELKAQRQILDQLIFRIDSKWNGNNLKGFLETSLLEMAQTDLADPGQGTWWRFMIQASLALREAAEPGADPLRFLEAYMSDSTVLTPKPLLELLRSQNYVGN